MSENSKTVACSQESLDANVYLLYSFHDVQ